MNYEIMVKQVDAHPRREGCRRRLPAPWPAPCTWMGAYQRLGDAHAAIRAWCAQQQRAFAGPNWEIYGHWTDDPEQVRTDVFYLLR